MPEPVEASVPFRWDLVTPDQLGSPLTGTDEPRLWFLDDLTVCAGKVLARSGNGDLLFVGRSLDSLFDLLSGVLAGTDWADRVRRVPLSFARPQTPGRAPGRPRRGRGGLDHAERAQARRVLADAGVDPHALARRDRPVTFVDVVSAGSTFTELYGLLRGWIDEDRGAWPVIRRKLRFVGVTSRRKTSPNAFRWQQHAAWTRHLPAGSVVNVSLHPLVWSYLGDHQAKLTHSYPPDRWLADAEGPRHDDLARRALAEAVALVGHGRSAAGRHAVARSVRGEPGLSHPWLRRLVGHLTRDASPDAT